MIRIKFYSLIITVRSVINYHTVTIHHYRIAEMTTTAQELYDKMLELYPNRVNPGWALWSSAHAVKQ
jgi:hypothetical protein